MADYKVNVRNTTNDGWVNVLDDQYIISSAPEYLGDTVDIAISDLYLRSTNINTPGYDNSRIITTDTSPAVDVAGNLTAASISTQGGLAVQLNTIIGTTLDVIGDTTLTNTDITGIFDVTNATINGDLLLPLTTQSLTVGDHSLWGVVPANKYLLGLVDESVSAGESGFHFVHVDDNNLWTDYSVSEGKLTPTQSTIKLTNYSTVGECYVEIGAVGDKPLINMVEADGNGFYLFEMTDSVSGNNVHLKPKTTMTIGSLFRIDNGDGTTIFDVMGNEVQVHQPLHVYNLTESTSYMDGSLVVHGGVGVYGDLYVNPTKSIYGDLVGDVTADIITSTTSITSGTITATVGFVGDLTGNVTGTFTGTLVGSILADDVTSSGTTTTDVLIVNVGVDSDLIPIGGQIIGDSGNRWSQIWATNGDFTSVDTVNLDVTGTLTATTISSSNFVGTLTGDLTGDVTGDLTGDVNGDLIKNSSPVLVTSNTGSTSPSTGAFVVQGGQGIAENLYIGGNLDVAGTITGIPAADVTWDAIPESMIPDTNNTWTIGSVGNVWSEVYATNFIGDLTGDVTGDLTGNLNATTTTAVNLETLGSMSVGTNLDVTGNFSVNGVFTTSFGNFQTVIVAADIESTSKDTGALVVSAGGLGVEGNIHAGGSGNFGTLNVSDSTIFNGDVTITSDVINITSTTSTTFNSLTTFASPVHVTDTTNAVDTVTGAVIVDGGVSIAQDLHVGGSLFLEGSWDGDYSGTFTGSVIGDVTGDLNGDLIKGTTVYLNNPTPSYNLGEGALVISGGTPGNDGAGLSVEGNTFIGGNLTVLGAVSGNIEFLDQPAGVFTFDTFALLDYRAVDYTITVEDPTVGSVFRMDVSVIHDGLYVYTSEYNVVGDGIYSPNIELTHDTVTMTSSITLDNISNVYITKKYVNNNAPTLAKPVVVGDNLFPNENLIVT